MTIFTGWAMMQRLPTGGFRWSDTNLDVTSVPEDSSVGYIFEVDLHIPESLHDYFRDYPPCPDHMEISNDMRSPFLENDIVKCKKLVPTLYDKEKYVVHYRALQLYLRLGVQLVKVHRVLAFEQRAWLKEYIDFNTGLRAAATNDFDKSFYKLMNNS